MKAPVNKQRAEALRWWMEQNNITNIQAAVMFGKGKNTISKWRRGKVNIQNTEWLLLNRLCTPEEWQKINEIAPDGGVFGGVAI